MLGCQGQFTWTTTLPTTLRIVTNCEMTILKYEFAVNIGVAELNYVE